MFVLSNASALKCKFSLIAVLSNRSALRCAISVRVHYSTQDHFTKSENNSKSSTTHLDKASPTDLSMLGVRSPQACRPTSMILSPSSKSCCPARRRNSLRSAEFDASNMPCRRRNGHITSTQSSLPDKAQTFPQICRIEAQNMPCGGKPQYNAGCSGQ